MAHMHLNSRRLWLGIGVSLMLLAGLIAVAQSRLVEAASDAPQPPLFLPLIASPMSIEQGHQSALATYEGAASCRGCHDVQARAIHASVHYQWQGPTPAVPALDIAGKLTGINDFCGYPGISWISLLTNLDGKTVSGGCVTCHTGLGLQPSAQATDEQLDNIDCLVCHGEGYTRAVQQGTDGKLHLAPTQTATLAAKPTNAACLTCHAYAGGGNNNKRGDIEAAHANPPSRTFDVHMASKSLDGAGLACIDCHQSENHRMPGRGVDLRPTDSDTPLGCAECHASPPHDSQELNRHLARVDCATCHIPTYAKIQSTEMHRDYSQAEVDQAKRLYEPKLTRQSAVTPAYRFFNGLSSFYELGTAAVAAQNGSVWMAGPLGSIQDNGAKIYPFKHHTAWLPYDVAGKKIIPVKLGILFQTGNTDAAIRKGAEAMGWPLSQGYSFLDAERYMGLYHEVAPADDALECKACHEGGTRLDFAQLGYTPKTERAGKALCSSCHEPEGGDSAGKLTAADDDLSFYGIHEKHVEEEGINCSECHTFAAAQ